MTGRLVFDSWISREDLRAHPDDRFVFGDNVQRVGLGGQAGSMRGEPNAIGVATKRAPGMADSDFFEDGNAADLEVIEDDIDRVVAALIEGRTVHIPRDGLGTGLSKLPERAPSLHRHIIERFRALAGAEFPWGE